MTRLSTHILALLSSSVLLAHAAPTNNYPLAIQYPPIVQYGKPYSYQLAADTFTSSEVVAYSVADLPDWLSFDGTSRTFSGTAPQSSSSSQQDELLWFSLIGTDSSGETSVNSSLLLTEMSVDTALSNSSLPAVLSNIDFQNTDTIAITPGERFTIKFPATAFRASSDSHPIIYYAALTKSHTPLPIWVSFNPQTLEFTGTAPALSSDAIETYPISLLAMQSSGFSSASIDFNLVLTAHAFTTDVFAVNQTVNNTEQFAYELPLSQIFLDGAAISPANISAVTLNTTGSSWLAANSTALAGTVPTNFNTTAYLVTIESVYASKVSFTLSLHVSQTETPEYSSIFSNSSAQALDVNATTGEYFQFQLPVSVIQNTNASISASYSPDATWLAFHADNATFNGFVPESFEGTTVTLTGRDGDTTETYEFDLSSVQGKSAETSATASQPAESTTSEPSTTPSEKKSNKKLVAILCGVLIPVGVLTAALLLFCCCWRRKGTKKLEISNPVLASSDGTNNNDRIFDEKSVEAMRSAGGNAGDASFSSDNSSTPFMTNPQVNYSGTQLPTRKPSFGNMLDQTTPVGTPVPSLSHKKSFGTPVIASEYNLFKLENPNKPFNFLESGSPMSHAYSEADSSDATQVGDSSGDTSGDRSYESADTASTPLSNILDNLNNLERPLFQEPGDEVPHQQHARTPSQQHSELQPQLEITASRDEGGHSYRNSIISTHSSIAPASSAAMAAVMKSGASPGHSPSASQSALPRSGSSDSDLAGKPRNSWRQTYEPGRRWHSRQQGGSLATISTDELYSVKLVSDDRRRASAVIPQSQSTNSVYSGSSKDTPSPILKRIGSLSSSSSYTGHSRSNTTSTGSFSEGSGFGDSGESQTSNSNNNLRPPEHAPHSSLDTVPESPKLATAAAVVQSRQQRGQSQCSLTTSEHYRTASSGESDFNGSESDFETDVLRVNPATFSSTPKKLNAAGTGVSGGVPGPVYNNRDSATSVYADQSIASDSPQRSSFYFTKESQNTAGFDFGNTTADTIRPQRQWQEYAAAAAGNSSSMGPGDVRVVENTPSPENSRTD